MRHRKVLLYPICRSVIVLAVLCVMSLARSGSVVPGEVRAQEPTSAPASINVSNLEITGAEKLDRGPYRSFVWSPDGTKALVSKTGSGYRLHQPEGAGASSMEGLWVGMKDLWVVDWASGQEELLVETAYRWAWSPDGSSVAYIAPVGESGVPGELYVIDLETKSSQRIAEADIVQSHEQPFWLQTGEIVYVASGHLWSVQPDGSDLHQVNDLHLNHIIPEGSKDLAPYNGPVRDFEISPTGKYIAYHDTVPMPGSRPDYRPRLWLAALDGRNAHVINENAVEVSWSPDSTSLAYVSWPDREQPYAENLSVIDAESGRVSLVYEASGPVTELGRVIWSPGSDVLAFRERELAADGSEVARPLWFVKSDASERRAFRDFEGLQVLEYSRELMIWNKDGKHLLVIPGARGGAGTPYLVDLSDSP